MGMGEREAGGRRVLPGMITYVSRAHYPAPKTVNFPSTVVAMPCDLVTMLQVGVRRDVPNFSGMRVQ
eukprot:826550-Pleurochrysis_carterae.AAC.1